MQKRMGERLGIIGFIGPRLSFRFLVSNTSILFCFFFLSRMFKIFNLFFNAQKVSKLSSLFYFYIILAKTLPRIFLKSALILTLILNIFLLIL